MAPRKVPGDVGAGGLVIGLPICEPRWAGGVNRSANAIDTLPKQLHAEAKAAVRELCQAPFKAECGRRRAEYCTKLRATGQGDAADCMERDWEDFVTFYDFVCPGQGPTNQRV